MPRTLGTLVLFTLLAVPSLSPAQVVDPGEEKHMTFMREEEKLARDVYLTLAGLYPRSQVFSTIADRSEQTHADTMADLLASYGIADPNPTTNALPGSIGFFTGPDFGGYFSEKFDLLVAWGSTSLLDALYVGAFIEELDMLDIVDCPKAIVDDPDLDIDAGECGLAWTDEARIRTVYGSLLEGSKRHLRSYVTNIEKIIGEGNYVAQVLTQEEVDAILDGT